jgi:hypothetical protein
VAAFFWRRFRLSPRAAIELSGHLERILHLEMGPLEASPVRLSNKIIQGIQWWRLVR